MRPRVMIITAYDIVVLSRQKMYICPIPKRKPMFKFLLTALIIYGIYRFFIAPPPALDRRPPQDELRNRATTDRHLTDDDGEYVDYEEVD